MSSQHLTISLIKISEKFFSLVYQLSKNYWFWFPVVCSSSRLKPLGINLAWKYCNKNSLCDLNLAFLSFRRFSFNASCSFFLSSNIGWLRKLFPSLFLQPVLQLILGWQGLLGSRFFLADGWRWLTALFAAFSVLSESFEERCQMAASSFHFWWHIFLTNIFQNCVPFSLFLKQCWGKREPKENLLLVKKLHQRQDATNEI